MAIGSRLHAGGFGSVKAVLAAVALALSLSGCAPALGVYAVMGVADLVVEVAEKGPAPPADESVAAP